MKKLIIIFGLFLGACGHSGPTPYKPPVVTQGWTAYAGSVNGSCDNFIFGEPHYCINSALPVKLGQTITMTFTTSGSGSLYPSSDSPPPRIALFLWRRGDNLSCAGAMQQYRYWSIQRQEIIVGQTQTITMKIDPDQWTDCYGQSGSANPAAFAAVLNDLYAVGYTFGGNSFAGHGVSAIGNVQFKLNKFEIGF